MPISLLYAGEIKNTEDTHRNWTIGISRAYFQYHETSISGVRLNTEKGRLNGFFLSKMLPSKSSRHRQSTLKLELSLQQNNVRYIGLNNLGKAVMSTTNELIGETLLHYARPFTPKKWVPALVLGAGYRYWRRDIHDAPKTLGLLEQYHWPYLMAGLQKIHTFTRIPVNLRFDFEFRYAFFPHMLVTFPSAFDAVWVPQGATRGVAAKISLSYQRKNYQWAFTPYINIWQAQRGASRLLRITGRPVGTVTEPQSLSRLIGARISLSL